ncbi:hypothetical protein ACF09I_34395 [Streptomyces sp. NPDC014940]|uniref:hypothetical protein n=1 Tax=Streptomyces sp. NPDC014940 TaxID=3364932 RepID=UPI0036F6A8BF
MSTELVKHTAPAASLPDMIRYAEHLADANLLPGQYRRQPANVLYAMEYGRTLGITPLAAITGIHVIEGKPSASAALISGLVRQAGHKLRVTGNGQSATAQIIRADDPEFTYSVTWELRRNANGNPSAEEAGLLNKDVWKKYAASMLKARAISQVARDACEEVLFGLHYTPEELDANVGEDGAPVDATVQQLRRVQPGEGDPWTVPASAEGAQDGMVRVGNVTVRRDAFQPYAPAQEIADKAAKAAHRGELAPLKDEAQKADVSPDAGILAPDTDEPDTLREYLARRWKVLPKPDAAPGDDGVVDAEVVETEGVDYASGREAGLDNIHAEPAAGSHVPDEDDEAAAAERELRAVAARVGLDNLAEEFERSYGIPLDLAPAHQLREMTAILTGSAA